ncbi:YheC/YheD family protein [Azospirillum halopraeferens]|uniref:YheC/YheD family protein n=1 Tax=Azospirillum halopraeferens TaxID=34010 RepID=UPI0004207A35|nr:YheC/YheD family protein [Azospirillum halopraeferens]
MRLRALAAEALVQGMDFVAFGTGGVDLRHAGVCGLSLGPEGWRDAIWPLPHVVMNPVHPSPGADLAAAAALRRVAPFTTSRIADKVAVAGLLAASPVAGHVIPYAGLDRAMAAVEGVEGLARRVGGFLAEHGSAVAKPARGRRGRDIHFLIPERSGGLRVRCRSGERPATVDTVAAGLMARLSAGPWILQRFVSSRTRDNRSFDVRVHVHKDGEGEWTVVRAYIRLSEAGGLVANTCCGGYQGDPERFFAALKAEAPARVEALRALGLATARAVDARYGGALDELGVDLVVDGGGRPWIVEVNTHPQSRHHEFERARLAVAYAGHLARRPVAAGEVALLTG